MKRLGATDEDLKNLGKNFSSIFDEAAETASRFANANGRAKRNADNLLKTLCWYDNGWGFSKRILDTIKTYHKDV